MARHGGMVILAMAIALPWASRGARAEEPTYAERLGWPAGSKVVLFHVDDMGMCHDANLGTLEALEQGVATSCSLMMPCSWVPEAAHYLQSHPNVDAGLHLTLTSEWSVYRWGPVAGKAAVPGLTDEQGCFWHTVEQVVEHATPAEVETELRAQVKKALIMGLKPTHLDSHMGTLFQPAFLPSYLKVGVESGIPIFFMGGHLQYLSQDPEVPVAEVRQMAQQVWDAGFPVIDDAVASVYDWKKFSDKKANVLKALREMKPGITEFIVHCTRPSDAFKYISDSGEMRLSDLQVVTDPDVQKTIVEQKIVLTTWRELKQRRDQAGAAAASPKPQAGDVEWTFLPIAEGSPRKIGRNK